MSSSNKEHTKEKPQSHTPESVGEIEPSSFSSIALTVQREFGCDEKTFKRISELEHRNKVLLEHAQKKFHKKAKQLERRLVQKTKQVDAMIDCYHGNPRDAWYLQYLIESNIKMSRQLDHQQEMIDELLGKNIT